jgi:protein-tyrosine phosphatase
MTLSVLFVCTGNICRSPLAEGLFQHKLNLLGLQKLIVCDSAGTGAWHDGERPDARSCETASNHGFQLVGSARQILVTDFKKFDYIIAMDRSNFRDLKTLAGKTYSHKVHLMREWDPNDDKTHSVPDPYYGAKNGFEEVYQILDRSLNAFLIEIQQKLNKPPKPTLAD